jgi:SNF2 family DNA or RNA helicase
MLIVCPNVAKGVWEREIAKWRPDFRSTILSGRGSFRWPKMGEAVIINYDILPDFVSEIFGSEEDAEEFEPSLPSAIECTVPNATLLIGDEAHYLKEYQSYRTQQFQAISDLVRQKNGRTWLLTATPLLNYPPELWTVFSAAGIAGEAFGSYKKFTALFGGKKGFYGQQVWSDPQPEIVDRIRRVSLRRRRDEVLPDLPTKMWREIRVDVDRVTKELCDEAVRSFLAQGVDLRRADCVTQLCRLEVPEIGAISRARAALATLKIPVLMSLLAECSAQEEPVIVFSAHRNPIDYVGKHPGWKTITGSTIDPGERTRIEEDFQNGRLLGIAATIQAGGVSITLTRAAHLIFVDRMFTPALNEQAEDRICRIGQKRGCLITDLVADHPLDRRLHEVLTQKQAMVSQSVDAARQRT